MSLEQPRPGEALAAEVALAALVVGPHVHAEGWYADVDLVAVRTASGLLVAEGTMCLTVSGQVRGGRVLFTTVGALVLLGAVLRLLTRILMVVERIL